MHDTSITLEGLKKLADTEKFYVSLIKSAVEQLTLLSDKWHSMISTTQNSENISEHEVDEIINTLKELLNAQQSADNIIKEYRNAQVEVITFCYNLFRRW